MKRNPQGETGKMEIQIISLKINRAKLSFGY